MNITIDGDVEGTKAVNELLAMIEQTSANAGSIAAMELAGLARSLLESKRQVDVKHAMVIMSVASLLSYDDVFVSHLLNIHIGTFMRRVLGSVEVDGKLRV